MTKKTDGQSLAQLTAADLQPADVLMVRGHGLVSDLIMKAEGGSYSHAALWSGVGVIQATSAGITNLPPEEGQEFDVYRRVGLDEEGACAVLKVAKAAVGGTYAYGELVMLGLLFSSGLPVRGAWLNRALEAIGGPGATALKQWLEEHAQKKIRVCTELVASSYFDASDKRFALRILPFEKRPPLASSGTRGESPASEAAARGLTYSPPEPYAEDIAAASAKCLGMLQDRSTRRLLSDPIAIDDTTGAEIGVVTPADLQFSPSLEFKGLFRA